MFGVGLEGQTACVSCGHVIQVNGLVASVPCPACGTTNELTQLWTHVAKAIPEMRRWPLGESMQHTVVSGERQLIVRRIRVDPPLPEGLDTAADKGWAETGGAIQVIRGIPEAFSALLPDARYVLDEDPTTLAEAGARPALPELRGVEGLTANCESCGASIDLHGTQRLVECDHCGAVAFLADTVWGRLHPDRRPRRFFLWLEGDAEPEHALEDTDAFARFDAHRLPPVSTPPPEAAFWVSLELVRTCERCNGAIPVPAVVETIACPTCQATHVITPAEWAETLIEACRDRESDDFYEEDDEAEEEGDDDEAAPAFSPEDARARLGLEQVADGGEEPWLRVPPPFVGPIVQPAGIELLMGEAPGVVSEALEGGPGVAGVTFECPQCGSALQPDGREREIECSHCGVGLGLPDGVWRRLHPISTTRFWVLYNPHAPVFDHDDLCEAAGDDDGRLYLVSCSQTAWRRRLYALDRALRLRWFRDLEQDPSPSVGIAARGPYVWWTEGEKLSVREYDHDGEELRRRSVAVPEGVHVSDVDPDLRVLGVQVRHGHKGRSFHTLMTLDLDTGACEPVWPAQVSLWRRALSVLAQNDRGPSDLRELSARPRWIPSGASVMGGAEGTIALIDRAVMTIFDAEGSCEHFDLAGDAHTDQIRRYNGGWLVPVDGSQATLQCVGTDGKRRTILPASESERAWPGWPALAEDGQLGVVTDHSFVLYDADGTLRFESWRTRQKD